MASTSVCLPFLATRFLASCPTAQTRTFGRKRSVSISQNRLLPRASFPAVVHFGGDRITRPGTAPHRTNSARISSSTDSERLGFLQSIL